MKTNSSKNNTTPESNSTKYFSNKNVEGGFFGRSQGVDQPFFNPSWIQPKLSIGQPGDKYEQEADSMAEKVMQKSEGKKGAPVVPSKYEVIPGEEKNQEKESDLESNLRASKGSGFPLPFDARSEMEAGFGADFANVRIHTGHDSEKMNRNLGSLAFTHQSDIYFNQGQYDSNSARGKRLLAHELTHIQQQSGAEKTVQKFEAPVHESAERYGLTREHGGTPSSTGLTNEEASNVYFGNWMRDVNQAFVPTLTNVLGPDLIFALLNYLSAKKFGRLLTPEMIGYYIPTEHMDNPAGLVAGDDLESGQPNISPGTRLDPQNARARPSNFVTRQESVSPGSAAVNGSNARLFDVDQTGTMAFIRRSNTHVERRLELAAMQGRNPEGMMHLGAALHAIEDLFAHSNWIEIAVEKVLRDRSDLLTSLQMSDPEVFNFSRNITLSGSGADRTRPVLTTGTFTGADTSISIISEVIGILRRPLRPAASDAEREAEERFIEALLTKFESRLENDPSFRAGLQRIMTENGVPGPVASSVLRLPITRIYNIQRVLSIVLPDVVPEAIRNFIRSALQTFMQTVADRIQAEGLESNVAGTSLINFLRQQQQTGAGNFSAPPNTMEILTEEFTGTSVENQRRNAVPSARRHVTALQGTPEPVVAGPSHSQIAKDHPNSPFFGIAFVLATHAIRRIREKTIAAWNGLAGRQTTPYSFEWANFPAQGDDRRLYHSTRTERSRGANESLSRGQRIVRQGGDTPSGQRFVPFNLERMRTESSNRIRSVANTLTILADTPGRGAWALVNLRRQIRRANLPAGAFTILQNRIAGQLDAAARSLSQPGVVPNLAIQFRSAAVELSQIAQAIRTARTHAQREQLNQRLVQSRNDLLSPLATFSMPSSSLRATIIIILNDEISRTAVSYSSEQRNILESGGNGDLFPEHTGSRNLQQRIINLPDLSVKPAVVRDLLQESRMILNHPYESNWWVDHVVEYIRQNPDQIKADIEARNTGYAVFTRQGGSSGGTHQHP